jgi:septal ring factor EnvC (AmiA/AmiB activator)
VVELFTDPGTLLASGIIGLLGALFGFLGTRYRSRHELKVQQHHAQVEHAKIDAEAYDQGRQIWESIVNDLREQVADQRKDLIVLRQQVGRDREEISALRNRMEDLELQHAADRRALRRLVEYARQLRQILKANGLDVPPAPDGLGVEDTDPGTGTTKAVA